MALDANTALQIPLWLDLRWLRLLLLMLADLYIVPLQRLRLAYLELRLGLDLLHWSLGDGVVA